MKNTKQQKNSKSALVTELLIADRELTKAVENKEDSRIVAEKRKKQYILVRKIEQLLITE